MSDFKNETSPEKKIENKKGVKKSTIKQSKTSKKNQNAKADLPSLFAFSF